MSGADSIALLTLHEAAKQGLAEHIDFLLSLSDFTGMHNKPKCAAFLHQSQHRQQALAREAPYSHP